MTSYAHTTEELNALPIGSVVTPYGYTEGGWGTKLVKCHHEAWWGDDGTTTFASVIGKPAQILDEVREVPEPWNPFASQS